jgi:DNA-directed RNA polymerase subunit beta'
VRWRFDQRSRSRQNIVNPVTDEMIVQENQMITPEIARKIEEMGLEKIQVRSPMTCDAPLGVCRNCYGMDMSTGALVEEGMAVGIIAAQSIGEPGTQLTMRTFHIGGACRTRSKKAISRQEGRYRQVDSHARGEATKKASKSFSTETVKSVSSTIAVAKSRSTKFQPVHAARQRRREVAKGQVLCEWNPHKIPILLEVSGKVRFDRRRRRRNDASLERDPSGNMRVVIVDHKGDCIRRSSLKMRKASRWTCTTCLNVR